MGDKACTDILVGHPGPRSGARRSSKLLLNIDEVRRSNQKSGSHFQECQKWRKAEDISHYKNVVERGGGENGLVLGPNQAQRKLRTCSAFCCSGFSPLTFIVGPRLSLRAWPWLTAVAAVILTRFLCGNEKHICCPADTRKRWEATKHRQRAANLTEGRKGQIYMLYIETVLNSAGINL